jgi:acetolactate synthase I/II/III large subunit
MNGSGGALLVESLQRHGVDVLFTLNGGHLFPVYEACVRRGLRLVDVRHEQTAVFAAEGLAKLRRRPAVAALTAGPGVTNGISAIATAQFNGSPLLVVGGRAPQARWGWGSLQELDHVPLVRSITKSAQTLLRADAIPAGVDAALLEAATAHRGPVFLDVALDGLFGHAEVPDLPAPRTPARPHRRSAPPLAGLAPDPEALTRIARRVAEAKAPLLVVGSDVYWAEAWPALQRVVEAGRLPTFASGLGRGTLPADHTLAFMRARSLALRSADLVVVAGAPLDFRLGFGRFGSAAVVQLVDSPEQLARHAALADSAVGDLELCLSGLAEALLTSPADAGAREGWLERLRAEEAKQRAADAALLGSDADPIHPARIYGELRRLLDRDAIVIGDGGDFVSFAGRYLESYQPGAWLDPGPFGCLGTGLGYAIAARLAHPDRQVVLLLGDGALGFSAMDFDTLVRFHLPVCAICGNNGVWGLEKHPMRMLYGFDAATDLQPGCRYDKVVEALGGFGQLVTRPDEIGPAIERALASGQPSLVNVITDPAVAYPRSTNLA